MRFEYDLDGDQCRMLDDTYRPIAKLAQLHAVAGTAATSGEGELYEP